MGARRSLLGLLAVAGTLLCAPAALADSTASANWAGYAVHRPGVSFRYVAGAWRQPTATCTRGEEAFSAIWVGIGGYSVSSSALEQIGTEVDCTALGRVSSSAWLELIPAPSQTISLRVRPGDLMGASVTVNGHQVTLAIDDATTRRSFKRTLYAAAIDTASAEWIVEAPSDCLSSNQCQTLPLADFGSAMVGMASARTTAGHPGTIGDRAWDRTRITLLPGGRRFVGYGVPEAIPTELSGADNAFKVVFSRIASARPTTFSARSASVVSGRLVHGVSARHLGGLGFSTLAPGQHPQTAPTATETARTATA
ncbi:MAG: G1 family glutamic endopeptidase [Solirubrobacteraceae bacterium]